MTSGRSHMAGGQHGPIAPHGQPDICLAVMPGEIRVDGCQLSENPIIMKPGISTNIPRQREDYSLVGGQG